MAHYVFCDSHCSTLLPTSRRGTDLPLLPDAYSHGLRTAVQIGLLEVVLWTYEPEIGNVPPGVVCRPANSLFDATAARSFLGRGGAYCSFGRHSPYPCHARQ